MAERRCGRRRRRLGRQGEGVSGRASDGSSDDGKTDMPAYEDDADDGIGATTIVKE